MGDKKSKDSGAAASAPKAGAAKTAWPDGYEGLDWDLYLKVRPNKNHSGASGAGLVEYTLWFEVIQTRPEGDRHDVGLPGQPVR